MKKFVCSVCGYVHEGDQAPEKCPQCKVPAEKIKEMAGEKTWACEHEVGVARGVDQRVIDGLRANFEGECSEVGMYLAMARVAHRQGYPEIGLYWEKAAYEEAASKFWMVPTSAILISAAKSGWIPARAPGPARTP